MPAFHRRKMLDITQRQTNGTTILDLSGNVIMGGGSKRLGEEVRRLSAEGNANVLLNFSDVKYLDSSGVGELLALSNALSQAEGTLKLTNLSPKVEEVLTLSGVLPMFDIYDDERAALESE
jgi:anti-sigma B factor antagonist